MYVICPYLLSPLVFCNCHYEILILKWDCISLLFLLLLSDLELVHSYYITDSDTAMTGCYYDQIIFFHFLVIII